jgi:ribonuclease P protein component
VQYEENLSAEPPGSKAAPWVSRPHGDEERTQGACPPPGQGAQAPVGVTDSARTLERLKKRRDFLAAAKGYKAARRAFVLEARRRGDEGPPCFGFTVSRRVAAKAVERNRIRRRLKELVRLGEVEYAAGHDYVLVARRSALTEDFTDLRASLETAFAEVRSHRSPRIREGNPTQ